MKKDMRTLPPKPNWLTCRLMSAIHRGDLGRVKGFLKLGADPNRPWPTYHHRPDYDITIPLALAVGTLPSEFAHALILGGADVSYCLHFLSASDSPSFCKLSDAMTLCELVAKESKYRHEVGNWLQETSVKLEKMPKPDSLVELWVAARHQFYQLCGKYDVEHELPVWAIEQLL